MLLVLLAGGAMCLVPWIGYLVRTLPESYETEQWRTAWVGFDVALGCCFASAAWLGFRRRRAAVPLLAATAALLCCDAWFDVLLDWSSPDRWTSVALAVSAEVPIALLLVLTARRLLTGDLRPHELTLHDLEAAPLRSGAPEYVREPRPEDFPAAQRARVADYLDGKYERELELLSWAAAHRDEFGPWGKAQRASAQLSEAELRAFEAEYLELLTRYCRLRRRPGPGARQVLVRFYAFPAAS
ncbi:hypothetical protein HFP15_32315 [Amycolatopsis sp. K13G38]|uniref:DUF2637 domain-containing protein n=2 Tax=Amycolatopsis acididurans TaxID=2724524 RepID=A0ABX1JDN3_9PSEU|nr:hypothetical protein [Amycolatopsis acididurans]